MCSCVCVSNQHCHTNRGFVNEPLIGNPPPTPGRSVACLPPPLPTNHPSALSGKKAWAPRELGCVQWGASTPLPSHTPTTLCWMLAGVVLGPQASLSPGGALKPGTADSTFRELGRGAPAAQTRWHPGLAVRSQTSPWASLGFTLLVFKMSDDITADNGGVGGGVGTKHRSPEKGMRPSLIDIFPFFSQLLSRSEPGGPL